MNKYSCIYFNLSSTTNLKNVINDKNENKNIENKNNNKNNRELFVTKDVFVENEIYISSQIKQMINYYKYFYIINKVEKINYMSIENKNVYENANDDDDNENINNSEYELNIKYRKKINSNDVLIKYINVPIINFKDYLKQNHSNKRFLFHAIINTYDRLLKSINMLNENNIFYNYLNAYNILINTSNDLPLLSNFSFSISIDKNNNKNNNNKNNNNKNNNKNDDIYNYFKKIIFHYDPTYTSRPIELHVVSFMVHYNKSSLSHSNINEIINDLINNNTILDNFSENIKQKYYNDGLIYLNTFLNKSIHEVIDAILIYFKTWDNHSLSIVYLEMFINIYKSLKANKSVDDIKFIYFTNNFMKLLLKNISFNPAYRFTLRKTKHDYNILLNNMSQKEYKDIITIL